jgi:hypothetical protein
MDFGGDNWGGSRGRAATAEELEAMRAGCWLLAAAAALVVVVVVIG